MAFTQTQLRDGLLREVGDYFLSACTGVGTTTTVVDTASKYFSTHEKDNKWLTIPALAAGRQSRRISSFDTSTGTFTVGSLFGGVPQIADVYYICDWPYDEIEKALNNASRHVAVSTPTADTSLTWVDNQYLYAIPAGLVDYDVFGVEIKGTYDTESVPSRHWKRQGNYIQFSADYVAGNTIKLWYYLPLTALSTEAGSWSITAEQAMMLYAQAAIELYKLLWSRSTKDTKEEIKEHLTYWMAEATKRRLDFGDLGYTQIMRNQ